MTACCRTGKRDAGVMAEGAPRRGGHLPGPRRPTRRRPRRGAGRDPGRRPVAPVAQPGRIRRKAVARHRGCLKIRPGRRDTPAPGEPAQGPRAEVTPEASGRGGTAGQAHPGALRRDKRTPGRRADHRRHLPRYRPGPQDRAAVRRAASLDDLLVTAGKRESKLEPFKPWICQRWNEGVTDAAALHAELRQRGWTGQRADRPPLRRAVPAGRSPPRAGPRGPETRHITRCS